MADREWILLNPGPANTTATVRAALVMPDLCHREPEYFDMMRRCRAEVTRLAGCGDDLDRLRGALIEGPVVLHLASVRERQLNWLSGLDGESGRVELEAVGCLDADHLRRGS